MITKTELVNLILPVIKEKLIGSKHPHYPQRVITDVSISYYENEYHCGGCDSGGASWDDFTINIESATPKRKFGWERLYLV